MLIAGANSALAIHLLKWLLAIDGRHGTTVRGSKIPALEVGRFPGMYLPLDYWRRLVADDAALGKRGGRLVTYENVGRKLSESEFIALIAGGGLERLLSRAALSKRLFARCYRPGDPSP